jgi:hypothetical protein
MKKLTHPLSRYGAPGFEIKEELRSESCRASEKRVGEAGDVFDTSKYIPERWLAKGRIYFALPWSLFLHADRKTNKCSLLILS